MKDYLTNYKPHHFGYFLCILLLVIIIISIINLDTFNIFKNDPIYIGVAAPMSGEAKEQGIEMLKGINFFVNRINQSGGIQNRPISLVIKDDKNDKSVAMKVASEFALDNNIVMILGHYLSSCSIVAGNIYQKSGIPAITATSTSEKVTFGNEWYFRVFPEHSFQAEYVVNYLKSYIGINTAVIIVDVNEYDNISLANKFKQAAKSMGFVINKTWEIDSSLKNVNHKIKSISNELQFIDNPGAVFIASQTEVAVKIVTVIKRTGADNTIIGPGSFANSSFINALNTYPRERAIKGYYSNNIHVFVPFIPEMSNAKLYNVNKTYENRFNELPSWIAIGYHDAMMVAAEAIKKSISTEHEPINSVRQKIRNTLSEFNCYEQSIAGLSGPIYFNDNGDADNSLKFGIYKNQKLIPSYTQFYQLPDKKERVSEKNQAEVISINKRIVQETRIVYTGIDLIDIQHIDLHHLTCIAKFYLWFRYKGKLNHKNIIFSNAINPVVLNQPIFSETYDNITTVLYTVVEQFKIKTDFTYFPFDSHILNISFHHADSTKDRLIYVVDNNMPTIKQVNIFNGFDITNITLYQSTYIDKEISQFEDLSDGNTFSEFSIQAKLKREDVFFPFRYIIPISISFCILILCCYIHTQQKYFLIASVLIITGIVNVKVMQDISTTYMVTINLAFLAIYLWIALFIWASLSTYLKTIFINYQNN